MNTPVSDSAVETKEGKNSASCAVGDPEPSSSETETQIVPSVLLTRAPTPNHHVNNKQPRPLGGKGRQRVLQTLLVLSLTLLQQKVASSLATAATSPTRDSSGKAEPSVMEHAPQLNDHHEQQQQHNIGDDEDPHDDLLVTIQDDDDDDEMELDWEEEAGNTLNNDEETGGQDILIVSTADGSMMGLSKLTGDLVWKQSGQQLDDRFSSNGANGFKTHNHKKHVVSESPPLSILEPLVATTTTAGSFASRDWRTAAVPSLDGKTVYLTAHAPPSSSSQQNHHHHRTTSDERDTSPEITVTTSIPDLVGRAPFVDNRGRIYNGSRSSVAVAVDGNTGEILKVVSTNGEMSLFDIDLEHENEEEDEEGTFSGDHNERKRKRNVVWMGRVDHSISVHEPRSGDLDVKFSAAEIKSVRDMILGQSSFPEDQPPWEAHDSSAQLLLTAGGESKATTEPTSDSESTSLWKAVTTTPPRSRSAETCLVATPNGNLAYRNPSTGEIEWVSSVRFDAPVAFALDANSGASLPIDIVPDAVQPSSDLTQEIHRQYNNLLADSEEASSSSSSALTPTTNTDPLVGTLESGQLFAMPLGESIRLRQREREKEHALLSAAGAPTTLSSAHSKLKRVTNLLSAFVPVLGRTPPGYESSHPRPPPKRPCYPGTDHFPSCLISSSSSNSGSFIDDNKHKRNEDNGAIVPFGHDPENELGGGGGPPTHPIQPQPPPNKKYHKILRILGSWLPPLTLTLFVVSFELGRRKRQKEQDKADSIAAAAADGNETGVIQLNQNVILGYGGHGTVVFEGMLEGRKVAVKRMLQAYHASADREISLLIESDGHPNVVRYFLKEVRGDFVYLALELCDLSLHDLIGHIGAAHEHGLIHPDSAEAIQTVLWQIACGVKHLHSNRIVHRDLKPANILLADCRKSNRNDDVQESVFEIFCQGDYTAKISDMGLSKKLIGQSSFGGVGESSLFGKPNSNGEAESSITGAGPGTVGWQAPEVMMMRSDASVRSNDSGAGACETPLENASMSSPLDATGRTSRSVDIFSLGCIFYSTLVPGSHPFGREWYEREANIMHNKPDVDALRELSIEAFDLVCSMVKRNPSLRPTAKQVCEHPYFWSPEKRLLFLCDFSDRLETDGMGNNEDAVQVSTNVAKVMAVERNAVGVVGSAWDTVLDPELVSNRTYRTYDPSSVRDLLRLIRNKYHHFDELPDNLKASIGKAESLSTYFEKRFPSLLIHCFNVCREILSADDPLTEKYSIAMAPIPKLKNLELATSPIPEVATTPDSPPPPSSQATGETSESDECIGAEESDEQFTDTQNNVSAVEVDADLLSTPADFTAQGQEQHPIVNFDGYSSLVEPSHVSTADAGDVIVWESSTAAKTFNNRGWFRSDEDWARRTDAVLRKPNNNLKRCVEDPKFRTRLCNHWDASKGTFCPMRKKGKCVFAHGPAELRVKEQKRNRWGKLVDENGDNKNPRHSGGEDTYGAARSIETERKQEGKWNVNNDKNSGKKKNHGGKNTAKKEQTPSPESTKMKTAQTATVAPVANEEEPC